MNIVCVDTQRKARHEERARVEKEIRDNRYKVHIPLDIDNNPNDLFKGVSQRVGIIIFKRPCNAYT